MSDPYDAFLERVTRVYTLEHVEWILKWDQEVMMPAGGTPARAGQKSTISTIVHEELTDDRLGELLASLDAGSRSDRERAVIREIQRRRDRAMEVPDSVVADLASARSEAFQTWQEARREDDFSIFAPSLEALLELERRYAQAIDADADPFAISFQRFEPYLSAESIERVMDSLRSSLVPLVRRVQRSDVDIGSNAFGGPFPGSAQKALCRDILDAVGFDWNRGRFDTAPYPFANGTPYDARISMRFDETDLPGTITTLLHEFGHANYIHNLPRDAYGTPLAEPRGYFVHESMARFWQNHVGHSKAFWEYIMPTVGEHFPDIRDLSVRAAYESANKVVVTPIWTEADQLSNHLHIILRFELVRDLFDGRIDVAEIPQVWEHRMQEYLGITPDSDRDGFLQDIHWSHGQFAYFPNYSLGSVFAAQLYDAMCEDVAVDEAIRRGEFDSIGRWLERTVHQHGQYYTTDELVEAATGSPLNADPFIEYVTDRYTALYDL